MTNETFKLLETIRQLLDEETITYQVVNITLAIVQDMYENLSEEKYYWIREEIEEYIHSEF